jgi:hypothetical protein
VGGHEEDPVELDTPNTEEIKIGDEEVRGEEAP